MGTFVATLTGLQDLRTGNTDEALRRLESHCFATAVGLLEDSRWYGDPVLAGLIPELISYRAEFRTIPTEWTPAEKILEDRLAQYGYPK